MNFLFTAPITRANIDGGGSLSGVNVRQVNVDLDTGNVTIVVGIIEDGQSAVAKLYSATFALSANTNTSLISSLKTALSTKYGVTFQ